MITRDSTIAVGGGSLWVVTGERGIEATLSRFDTETGELEAAIGLPGPGGSGVIYAEDAAWVVNIREGELYRIDPRTNGLAATIEVNDMPGFAASAGGYIFVNGRTGSVDRVDPRSNTVTSTIETNAYGYEEFAVINGHLWLETQVEMLFEINPATGTLVNAFDSKDLQIYPTLSAGAGSLWAMRHGSNEILRIDPHAASD